VDTQLAAPGSPLGNSQLLPQGEDGERVDDFIVIIIGHASVDGRGVRVLFGRNAPESEKTSRQC
jgi:hypothetical protein